MAATEAPTAMPTLDPVDRSLVLEIMVLVGCDGLCFFVVTAGLGVKGDIDGILE
jgi:hypothetical protein